MANENNHKAPFNFGNSPLIKQTEEKIENGYEAIEKKEQKHVLNEPPIVDKPTEQTKGVQTYIPMSQYRRLNDIKLTRGENIATLVAQAIDMWLDVQEGKKKIES